jgi:hypothetical protein
MRLVSSGLKGLFVALAGIGLCNCEREKDHLTIELPSEVTPTTTLPADAGASVTVPNEVSAPYEIPKAPPHGLVDRPSEYRDFPSPEEMDRLQEAQYRELKEQRTNQPD